MENKLIEIYKILLKKFGQQQWWPVTTNNPKLEIVLGAILTQNTSWKNVEKAIKNLKDRNLLDKKALEEISIEELAQVIKPTGYYNQKAKKIKEFIKFNKKLTRNNILKIWGIGKETADSILLYAFNKPYFVIDAYTKRIISRLNLTKNLDYNNLQNLFTKNLPKNVKLYKEYHALIVELGKRYCKKEPLCDSCPLSKICKNSNVYWPETICHI